MVVIACRHCIWPPTPGPRFPGYVGEDPSDDFVLNPVNTPDNVPFLRRMVGQFESCASGVSYLRLHLLFAETYMTCSWMYVAVHFGSYWVRHAEKLFHFLMLPTCRSRQ